jgi:hypothetical protein
VSKRKRDSARAFVPARKKASRGIVQETYGDDEFLNWRRSQLWRMIYGNEGADEFVNQMHALIGEGFVSRPEDALCSELQIKESELDSYLSASPWQQVNLNDVAEGRLDPPESALLLVKALPQEFHRFRLWDLRKKTRALSPKC